MSQGFRASPHVGVAGKQESSKADNDAFVEGIFGESAEPFLRHAVARAVGRFEAARAGEGVDRRLIVEKQSGTARSGERWRGSLRQSRLLRYRRVCQFCGKAAVIA
jgi:hypothetical protein